MNEPLAGPPSDIIAGNVAGDTGYSYPNLRRISGSSHSDEILFALAFSGGGMRSAAFSYGVLQGLRDLALGVDGQPGRALDQVDIIASVSGGTFTSSYYGLYRDRIFTDYERDFLSRDVNSDIEGVILIPTNWQWMVDPNYGTNDAMAGVYDEVLYHGATFADMEANGLPLINIAATDITAGDVFVFNQQQFDLLCSNLTTYPLARAVAASNGFPVIFTPITLESHTEQCQGYEPAWVTAGLAETDPLSRRANLARQASDYLDPERTQYVHLMDGGISDNLAMRGMLNALTEVGDNPETFRAAGFDRTRRIIMLSADGEAAQDRSWALRRNVSGISQILNLVTGGQIDRYNFETLQLARATINQLAERIGAARCAEARVIDGHDCSDVRADLVHLSLSQIDDADVRATLEAIPTGLGLAPEDAALLIRYGRELVLQSPELQALARDFPAPGTSRIVAAR